MKHVFFMERTMDFIIGAKRKHEEKCVHGKDKKKA